MSDPRVYTVGWICAIATESVAARAFLDEEHDGPSHVAQHDNNSYVLGKMGRHNVVIAVLPDGEYGTTSAALVARDMLHSFPNVRIGLMVGIGGGAPSSKHDIRLGDVVVSSRDGGKGGVFQYDFGKTIQNRAFQETGFLDQPPMVLRTAVATLKGTYEMRGHQLADEVEKALKCIKRRKKYARPAPASDRLFKPDAVHPATPDSCDIACVAASLVARDDRDEEDDDPAIHYGLIASGNQLMKDAQIRDKLATNKGVLCFEMEAAGLMSHYPCLVIRGICDYSDSHKNKEWQGFSAMMAAAYAKDLLRQIPPSKVEAERPIAEALGAIERKIDDLQQTTAATKAVTDSVRYDIRTDKIKCWLRPSDPSTNANQARKLRHEGTGVWLLENPVFQEWHAGSRRNLWLYALAGCGKTVLNVTVLDHLVEGNDSLILSFFFDFGDAAKQTVDGMLRSLTFQLYQGVAASAAVLHASFQAHGYGRDQPATNALSDVFSKMLAAHEKIVIVLDALDESTTRDELLHWITDVVSRPELGHIQLICTSRPESEFLRAMPSLMGEENSLALDKQSVNADIRSYVAAQLSERRDFRDKPLSQDILDQIRRKVVDGADGMFRWVFCQLDTLARCRHEAAIVEALASLPRTLGETYQRMIEHIPAELKNDGIRLLQFLVHLERPLTLAEAKEIIATYVESEPPGFNINRRLFCDTDILDYCPGLVTIVHTNQELHLAHFSVKEYLLQENRFSILTASISITRTCLTYLTDINCSHKEIKRDFPVARRAAEVWTRHAALAQASEDIGQATVRFLENEATFQRWAHLHQSCRDLDEDLRPPEGPRLYYACLFGLLAPVRALIAKGANVNEQGGYYGSALQAGSSNGHQEIITLLLDKGADVHAQGGDYGGNALQVASSYGHQEIITLLLDKGADVHAQGGDYGNNALQAASVNGHQEIVMLLLDKGADVNAQDGCYGNALQAASYGGYQEIVTLLLDKGADINAQGGYFGNALEAALSNSHQEIVTLLLAKGADVKAQGGLYGNALQAASIRGYQEIATLLLAKGADFNAQGGYYGNALQAASCKGCQGIVTLLLAKGADVNAQGGYYSNALQAASYAGHQEIVKLLLDKGANVNAQGGYYDNALLAALHAGHQEIATLLQRNGAIRCAN